jgi:REP element-mobilizing transposase RayT
MKKHRNSQKRIIFPDAVYFVTVKTHRNFPYFKESVFCDLFMENLRLCKRLKGFLLYGWVLIDDHFYLQIQPGDDFYISKVIQFLKRHVSRDVNWLIGYNKFDQTPEGDIRECRLQGGNYEKFQPIIDAHDHQLKLLKSRFHQKYLNRHPFPKFQWQESFHDHYIRSENDFDEHMEYIANNPYKHGLPENWPYVYTNSVYEDFTDECF